MTPSMRLLAGERALDLATCLVEVTGAGRGSELARDVVGRAFGRDDLVRLSELAIAVARIGVAHRVAGRERGGDDRRPRA